MKKEPFSISWIVPTTLPTTGKRDVFVKLKRTVGDAARKAGMGDTIDGWVSGFKLGSKGTANERTVSALEVTVNLVKER